MIDYYLNLKMGEFGHSGFPVVIFVGPDKKGKKVCPLNYFFLV